MSLLDTMSIALVEILGSLFRFSIDSIIDIWASIVSILFIMSVGIICKNKYSGGVKNIGISNMIGFTILAMIDSVIVEAMYVTTIIEYSGNNSLLLSFAFIGVILGIFIQLSAVILLFIQKNILKEKEEQTKTYLNEQKEHYEYLEKKEEDTKKFRHDLRSHMRLLTDLVNKNEYEMVDDYIEKMNIKIESIGNRVTVNNGIVDAVINKYYG